MTYVRQTSKETFDEIRINGLLSQRRWEIYEYLYYHGPCTAQQVFRGLRCQTNQSGRFTELRDMGVLTEVFEGECPVTGRNVIHWDVTSKLPQELQDKPRTKLERARAELRETEDELRETRNELECMRSLLTNVYDILDGETGKEKIVNDIADALGIERPLSQGWLF